jgi:adenosylhomocysteine nucleosidase
MIALLGALQEEIGYLQRRLHLPEAAGGPTCRTYQGSFQGCDVLLVRTGMGRQRAEAATRFVLDSFPIALVISFGFAGALNDDLHAGDVVLCSRLCCAADGSQTDPLAGVNAPAGALTHARGTLEAGRIGVHAGVCVTTSALITNPEEKQTLGRTFSADIADMESFWVAKVASERQVPTLVMRSISDALTDEIPPFMQLMTPDGGWRWKETAAYFLRRPTRLAALLPLYRNARDAGTNLAMAVIALIGNNQGACR